MIMNDYSYQGNDEPAECPECYSSMTETNSATSKWLQCNECEYQTRENKDDE